MGEFRRRESLADVSMHRRRRLFEMGVRGRLSEDEARGMMEEDDGNESEWGWDG